MTETEFNIELWEIIVNDLAFRSLNNVPHADYTEAEAIELLAERIRQGSLFIGLAIGKIAEALEARA